MIDIVLGYKPLPDCVRIVSGGESCVYAPRRTCRMDEIYTEGEWQCSECGYFARESYDHMAGFVKPNFCPNCGAKAVSDENKR